MCGAGLPRMMTCFGFPAQSEAETGLARSRGSAAPDDGQFAHHGDMS